MNIIINKINQKLSKKNILINSETKKTPDFYDNNEDIEYINIYSLNPIEDDRMNDYIEFIYDILEKYERYDVIVDSFYFDWVEGNKPLLIQENLLKSWGKSDFNSSYNMEEIFSDELKNFSTSNSINNVFKSKNNPFEVDSDFRGVAA
ncbi:MAG: hypothetical protein M0R46_01415 [Candidatus Muirbacterium halophilum]|nr:hypothetical protein [Candidatus Muirbacterium halophilum]MCK9474553.1 hypothetical protein [Candidatus Muirbacterium halophilum]